MSESKKRPAGKYRPVKAKKNPPRGSASASKPPQAKPPREAGDTTKKPRYSQQGESPREAGDTAKKPRYSQQSESPREAGDTAKKPRYSIVEKPAQGNTLPENPPFQTARPTGAAKAPYSPQRNTSNPSGRTAHEGQCPLYRRCGGCQLQNMDYPRQLAWKQARVVELLGKYCRVDPIIGMDDPYHYRNKVQAAFGMDRSKHIISGVYQSSTNTIVPVKNCMTEDRKADKILATIRKLMPGFKMLPYDEKSGRGFLRHVLIKRGFTSGEIMVVLVAATPIFPAKKRFVEALLAAHAGITTILFNINTRSLNMTLGDDERILYGNGFIEDTLCGCVFRISAKSFYQINPSQTARLYNYAIELAALTGQERVIDAYCGVGTIGLIASRHAKEVLGIEINQDAVRDAIANAKRNQIENVAFHCADASEFIQGMSLAGESADVVFIDPPRAGSDERFLAALIALAPKRIVYISCNPETQARDLRSLLSHGYRVQVVQPVDMFPHTNHIECVVKLCRVEK